MEVPNQPENASKCICGTCPSYIDGDTGFFCSLGESKNDVVKKGCVCSDCALWTEFELSNGYFCVEGKAS